jgi:hypothetical protein
VINVFNLGYLGVGKDFPDQKPFTPNRKNRRQKELAKEEKECNQIHFKKRIVMEHTICRMKKYRILSNVFRNRLRNYCKVSGIV